MVAKVFLLLLVVAAEYTIVLGNYRDIHYIRNCRNDCDEICSQPCLARVDDDDDWIWTHIRRDDICVATNCSNSCTKRCVARNSKQDDNINLFLRSYRNNRYSDTNNGLGLGYRNNSYGYRNNSYDYRNSKQLPPIGTWTRSREDVQLDNCKLICAEKCFLQCEKEDHDNWIPESRVRQYEECTKKCSDTCDDSCPQGRVSRRGNRKPGCHFHDWCD